MNNIEEYIRQAEREKKTSLIMCTALGFILVTLILVFLRFFY